MSAMFFSERVLGWFDEHGRKDLPWQQQTTPYRVWVSEIMLQQTQVATVIPYYERFMQRFPDLPSLAAASQDEVLHHWSGLGYYARARNLQEAARQVMAHHAGRFPRDLESAMALPGIGRSTAGAILSLACGQRQTILDGNVKRVLARHQGIAGWPGQSAVLRRLWALAEQLTPRERCADYNQVMMDLGATLCRRGNPACGECPLADDCVARSEERQAELPGRKPRKKLPVRHTHMLLLQHPDKGVLLERRPPAGIWGGLWSLPEAAVGSALPDWCRERYGCDILRREDWPLLRHTFSHYHLDIQPVWLEVAENPVDAVLEPDSRVWYKAPSPDKRGLAAPVKWLLDQLAARTGVNDDANGAMCETGSGSRRAGAPDLSRRPGQADL